MVAAYSYFSPEEYLNLEANSPMRHEYRSGLVYAMAGGSDVHDLISLALVSLLRSRLKGQGCFVHSGNVKVGRNHDFFYYPDVFVTCDPRDRDNRYIKCYPSLIAEVLSPSTERFDRGAKFEDYQQLETLKTYLLIAQDQMQVEVRQKNSFGIWETEQFGPADRFQIVGWNLEIAVLDLYEDVQFLGI